MFHRAAAVEPEKDRQQKRTHHLVHYTKLLENPRKMIHGYQTDCAWFLRVIPGGIIALPRCSLQLCYSMYEIRIKSLRLRPKAE